MNFKSLAATALLCVSLVKAPTAIAEDGGFFFGPSFSSDPVTELIQQLVEGICGDSTECVRSLTDAPDAPSAQRSAYLRQLGAYYVVTAFAQLGVARIPATTPDEDARSALAASLYRRIFEAREALAEDFVAASQPFAKRKVPYDLAKADTIVAVLDVIAAGVKPSVTRLKTLIGNPLALRREASTLIQDAFRDALYAQSYRNAFREVVTECKTKDPDCLTPAWNAIGSRLAKSCTTLEKVAFPSRGSQAKTCVSLSEAPQLPPDGKDPSKVADASKMTTIP